MWSIERAWLPVSIIAQVFRSFLICEKFTSLLYLLVFLPDIFRSCDCKFVFRLIMSTCKLSKKCRDARNKYHRSIKEKRTVTKAESLLVRGLGISPKRLNAISRFWSKFVLPKSIDKSSKTNQFPLEREYFKR